MGEISGMFKKVFTRKSSGKSDSSITLADQQNEPSEPEKSKAMKEETNTTDISTQDAIVITSRESSVTTEKVKVEEAKSEDQEIAEAAVDTVVQNQATLEAQSKESSPDFDVKEEITG